MRIALVVPGGVDRGGETRVIPAVLWLIERLARRHDVHVLVPRQEPAPGSWPLLGATIHNVGRAPLRVRGVAKLISLHAERPFDVFHALWARGAGETALAAARLCRRPVLVHIAGGELVWIPELPFGSRWPWRRALARFVLRHADRVTAASAPILDDVARLGIVATRVPRGVDTRFWTPVPPRPRLAGRPPRLVHVGSLTPVKGHPILLRALAALAGQGVDAHLDLVGVDAWDGHVQRLARELGVADRTTFHGFLTNRDTVPIVRRADLMVVSSWHEGGPVAMREAAAVGVPTVGSAVGHVAEWAPEAAVAVPTGDADALARAIAGLLADEARRLALARVAQERSLREDADWVAARFEDLYDEVMRDGQGS